MGPNPGQFGKILIFSGLILITAGVLVMVLSKLGLFRLPGDMEWSGRNWKIYFPITTCIILSIILTIIAWLIRFFRQ